MAGIELPQFPGLDLNGIPDPSEFISGGINAVNQVVNGGLQTVQSVGNTVMAGLQNAVKALTPPSLPTMTKQGSTGSSLQPPKPPSPQELYNMVVDGIQL